MTHYFSLRLHCICCGLYNLDVRTKRESKQIVFTCHHCQKEIATVMTICECRTTRTIEFPQVGKPLLAGQCDADPWATSSIRKAQKANKLKRGVQRHRENITVGKGFLTERQPARIQ